MEMLSVEIIEIGERWILEHYFPGIVWEYDPNKPFKLHSVAAEFVEATYPGVPYRIPTWQTANQP